MAYLCVMVVLGGWLSAGPQKSAGPVQKRQAQGRAFALHELSNSLSGVLQIGRRLLAALGHHFIGEALAFVECAHAGAFDRADMDEHVLRAVARRDESKTFLGIEKLYCTCGHIGLPASIAA